MIRDRPVYVDSTVKVRGMVRAPIAHKYESSPYTMSYRVVRLVDAPLPWGGVGNVEMFA
jgi:hypothetical protein